MDSSHWASIIVAAFVALIVLGARYDRPRHQRRWMATVALFPAPDPKSIEGRVAEYTDVPYREHLRVPGAGARFPAIAFASTYHRAFVAVEPGGIRLRDNRFVACGDVLIPWGGVETIEDGHWVVESIEDGHWVVAKSRIPGSLVRLRGGRGFLLLGEPAGWMAQQRLRTVRERGLDAPIVDKK
jgi:hypothetical protein